MSTSAFLAKARQHVAVGTSLVALFANLGSPLPASAQSTATPIKHAIVIIGENRTFDHIYATYKSPSGDSVNNLLSEGIIKADGTPGPNYGLTAQYTATDTTTYSISPGGKTVYSNIPPVVTGGPEVAYGEQLLQGGVITSPYQMEPGFLPYYYYQFLLTGGTGLSNAYTGPDTRIPNDLDLPE